jgi:hypothetical protein
MMLELLSVFIRVHLRFPFVPLRALRVFVLIAFQVPLSATRTAAAR